MNNFKRGFTLIEIMVVLGIMVLIIAVVLPAFSKMRDNQLLKSTTADVFSSLNKAKSQTLSSVSSSEYGVHFESDKIVIFKGTTYSSSDPNNEIVLITSPASISSISLTGGAVDLYFNRLTGAPNKTGSITVAVSSLSKAVTISGTGAISMQ